jgi:hypothetical protein
MSSHTMEKTTTRYYNIDAMIQILQDHKQAIRCLTLDWCRGTREEDTVMPVVTVEFYEATEQ